MNDTGNFATPSTLFLVRGFPNTMTRHSSLLFIVTLVWSINVCIRNDVAYNVYNVMMPPKGKKGRYTKSLRSYVTKYEIFFVENIKGKY